jgi:hypothetical protein
LIRYKLKNKTASPKPPSLSRKKDLSEDDLIKLAATVIKHLQGNHPSPDLKKTPKTIANSRKHFPLSDDQLLTVGKFVKIMLGMRLPCPDKPEMQKWYEEFTRYNQKLSAAIAKRNEARKRMAAAKRDLDKAQKEIDQFHPIGKSLFASIRQRGSPRAFLTNRVLQAHQANPSWTAPKMARKLAPEFGVNWDSPEVNESVTTERIRFTRAVQKIFSRHITSSKQSR